LVEGVAPCFCVGHAIFGGVNGQHIKFLKRVNRQRLIRNQVPLLEVTGAYLDTEITRVTPEKIEDVMVIQ
jgi:hypothetical protein